MARHWVGTALVLAALCIPALQAAEQPDYWGTIRAHLTAAIRSPGRDSPEVKDARAYLDSLSAGQLIIAGRQAGAEMEVRYAPEVWDEAAMNLAFFAGLPAEDRQAGRSVPHLLGDGEPGKLPVWRRFLVRMDWDDTLTDNQRIEVSRRLLGLLLDAGDSPHVRSAVAREVASLLWLVERDLKKGENAGTAGTPETRELNAAYVSACSATRTLPLRCSPARVSQPRC